VSQATDQEVCRTYIIQEGKKWISGLTIVFREIQAVTGLAVSYSAEQFRDKVTARIGGKVEKVDASLNRDPDRRSGRRRGLVAN
jgi:hypothetical protein